MTSLSGSGRVVDEQHLEPGQDLNVSRERVENRRRDVAVIALRDQFDRILMVRTRRLPGRWQPIGGGLDPQDRNPAEAIVREVFEETNLRLRAHEIQPMMETSYDFGDGTIYFFQAILGARADEVTFNEREIVDHGWFTIAQARDLPVFPATSRFLATLS